MSQVPRYGERAAEIAGRLRTLSDPGVVHRKSKKSSDWKGYLAAFTVPGDGGVKRVCGWSVSRAAAGLGESDAHWEESWELVRVVGVHDASDSEIAFQESLDEAAAHFRDNATLDFGIVKDSELSIQKVYTSWVGAADCHIAECELKTVFYFDQLPGGS